jgi:ribosomal protein S18 acetylase RimI-like enzyme
METFDDDTIPAWNILQRKLTLDGYRRQMEQRLELCRGGRHALIVAVNSNNQNDYKKNKKNNNNNMIAGFMELGTMPSPVPIQVNTNTTWNDVVVVVEKTIQPEMPFLANLAVDKKYRRCGVGTKLVQLAVKVSTKWCVDDNADDNADDIDNVVDDDVVIRDYAAAALYLAVEKENSAAVRLYDGLNFCRVLDETEQTWSSKKLERKLKERKPRVYFERKLAVVDGARRQAEEDG